MSLRRRSCSVSSRNWTVPWAGVTNWKRKSSHCKCITGALWRHTTSTCTSYTRIVTRMFGNAMSSLLCMSTDSTCCKILSSCKAFCEECPERIFIYYVRDQSNIFALRHLFSDSFSWTKESSKVLYFSVISDRCRHVVYVAFTTHLRHPRFVFMTSLMTKWPVY